MAVTESQLLMVMMRVGDCDRARRWAVIDHGPVESVITTMQIVIAMLRMGDDDNACDEISQGAEFVGDQQHGDAGCAERGQDIRESLLIAGVDTCCGLIQHEQISADSEGAGDHDATLLTAGELIEPVMPTFPQTHVLEGIAHRRTVGATQWPEPAWSQTCRAHGFQDGHRHGGCADEALRYVGDTLPLMELPDGGAEELHGAV